MQSWEWGAVREAEGKSVVRFVCSSHPEQSEGSLPSVTNDDCQLSTHDSVSMTDDCRLSTVDSVFQMTLHPIPHTGYSIGYIPKSSWPTTEFLRYLKGYCHTHHILFVKFEPDVLQNAKSKAQIEGLQESSHPLFTSWNQVLDISKSEDELLAAMHPKTRYNIKLAAKKGVTVADMSTDEGYAIFEKLYFDTTKRQGYRGHLPAYHRNIWKHLKVESHEQDQPQATNCKLQESTDSHRSAVDSLDSIVIPANAGISNPDTLDPRVREDDLDIRNSKLDISSSPVIPADESLAAGSSKLEAHILIASYQGEPLAAFQVWHFKDTIYYTYGGSSEKHRNLMAANLLMWETMRLGRSLGARTLDMWGSLPPDHDDSDPWAGFTRFKSGYGTEFVQYAGSYDLPSNIPLYHVYNLVQSIRNRLL